jgi:hypothetical protein
VATSQTFQFTDWLSMETPRLLTNKLTIAKRFNTRWQKDFQQEFAVGESIRVPLPNRGNIRTGLGYSPNPITRIYTTVNCNQVFGYDFEWNSVQAALETERGREAFTNDYLDPATSQIAQEIDSRAAYWASTNTPNIVGILGTDPTSLQTLNQARQRLAELACPPSGKRSFSISPEVNTSLVPSQQGFFAPASAIAKTYETGALGSYAGFDFFESMSLYENTAGTWQGAVTINTAPVSGATTLVLNCTSGDTFKTGNVIGVDAVYKVNPMTRRVTNRSTTATWVIPPAADGTDQSITATGTTVTIPITPVIYGPDSPYQNVSALPLANAAVTLYPGTSSPNGKIGKKSLAIHEEAFGIVGVKLEIPKAAEMSFQRRDPETGIYISFVRMFDPQQRKMINRFDVVLGFGNIYNDNCAVAMLTA